MAQPRALKNGQYELGERLYEGGIASVFRARERGGGIVAVKTYSAYFADSRSFTQKFNRLARKARSVSDESVVPLYDYGADISGGDRVLYAVMEYVDGRSVRDLLHDARLLTTEQALWIAEGVLRALDCYHKAGLVHGDIKPGTVMVSSTTGLQVLSFGSLDIQDVQEEDVRATSEMFARCAPENLSGGREDARTDIYAAGYLICEMLTGLPPFPSGASFPETLQRIITDGPLLPSQLVPGIPSWADTIVAKAMAKDPGDRYQSAAEMLVAIQAAQRAAAPPALTAPRFVPAAPAPERTVPAPATGAQVPAPKGDAPEPPAPEPARAPWGVFISYRREDAGPYARLLQLHMREEVPDARVFMDLDSIEPGLDFADVIKDALGSCAVLIALIGRQWATIADEEGHRRLDDPDDYVRHEVQTALERGVRVIPVLVDGARPPRQQQLPEGLTRLARLNSLELSYGRYDYDARRLFDTIQRVLNARGNTGQGG